ncbi:NAD-dependent protein deacetylase sirtuin-2 [Polyodon spathula]|uniref:NAD-dependent protein deacetylase sirtuin-2 n=1 Tax=Polyodon spathula TaxID=7913 RepID=UPI001B7F5ECE|nr:NAD-dependent protein deacetylase sirtuin-2 [Polyodon spathula]
MSDPEEPISEAEADSLQDPQEEESSPAEGATEDLEMDFLRSLFSRMQGLGSGPVEQVLDELSLEGMARYMQSGDCKNIICMVGAGISTSAGIPDFRSPGTGLYSNLQKYNLPCPEAIFFEIGLLQGIQHPEPFFTLARELYPGQFKPTVCHYFMRMLKEKGLLRRCYTQNIDTLERVAGLQEEDLIEAHGTFHTSHCLNFLCREEYGLPWMKEKIFSEEIPKCEKCNSLVKPDIVFFGESLPARFSSSLRSDFPRCDLLIIMGTSLSVQPFASLVMKVPPKTPRLLINREKTGESDSLMSFMGLGGMDFDSEKAYRDVVFLGSCDDGCLALAELLGWKDELVAMVTREHAAIDASEGGGASASMANQSRGTGDKGAGQEQKDKPASQSGAGERGKEG